ncbi:hypothetical protein QF037_009487 [Streptomyces canus]|uniref:hypothetical protein n=1 Tax=Streptomyces canus TaxID=58343 RepID=UPI0027855354|nr:hypothetical protein [Streptomyces canus]MDQ0605142.1 hypothetical protein [Streptomyces canus]
MELVAEFLNHPPVPSELGPVLQPDDVAAGKTLWKAGYTRERLMELARNPAGK